MKVSLYGTFQELQVSSIAVAKTIKLYDGTGSQEDNHSNGRPGVTSAAEDMFIRVTSLRSSSNRHISTSTVQRSLCDSGLHGRFAAKKPPLKDTNNKKRLAWAKKHGH